MKKYIVFTFLIVVFSKSFCFSETVSANSIVLKTEQQRLLCETITKNYLMITSNIKIYEAKSQMDNSIYLFEKNLKEISIFNSNKETRDINSKISDLWINFYNKVNKNYETSKSFEVMELSLELQNAYINLETHLKLDESYVSNEIYSLFNKQKFTIEKIAKFCLAKFSNISDVETKKQLKFLVSDYENNLIILLKNKKVSSDLSDHIKDDLGRWMSLKILINNEMGNIEITQILSQIDIFQKECNLATDKNMK